MSKPKVSPPDAAQKQTVSLNDVTITIQRPKIFHGEPAPAEVTFDGVRLAEILRWIALERPRRPASLRRGFGASSRR